MLIADRARDIISAFDQLTEEACLDIDTRDAINYFLDNTSNIIKAHLHKILERGFKND